MKKTAFIVEGHTEQIFVSKFLQELTTSKKYAIELLKLNDGRISKVNIRSNSASNEVTHYIQILSVENDEKVVSFILENSGNMLEKGFTAIYGLRDKYTGSNAKKAVDQSRIDLLIQQSLNTPNISVTVAIEEIEAWFIADGNIFPAYNKSLSKTSAYEILSIDPNTVNWESIQHPAAKINQVLRTVHDKYSKSACDIERATNAIDYSNLYLNFTDKIPSLSRFVKQLENCLA